MVQMSMIFIQTRESEGLRNQTIVPVKRTKEIYSEEENTGLGNGNNGCFETLKESCLKEAK